MQHKTGLPISTYFSAVKLRWLLDNVDEVRQAVLSGRALFGTVDSWIIWVRAAPHKVYYLVYSAVSRRGNMSPELSCFPQCLTGGSKGGVHCTDVSNASRTMLFNIHTMDWDPELCRSATLPSARGWCNIWPTCRSSHVQFVTTCCGAAFRYFDVPMEILPKVRSSSEVYGWMVS